MKKERLTGTLSRPNRPLMNHLAEAGFDEGTIQATLPWSNKLEADAQRWMMRGGFAERGRIDKSTAHRMWVSELRKVGGK